MPQAISLVLELGLAVLFLAWMPKRSPARMHAYAEALRASPDDSNLQVAFYRRFIARWWLVSCVCILALTLDGQSAWSLESPSEYFEDEAPLLFALFVGAALFAVGFSLVQLQRNQKYREAALAMLARLQDTWAIFPRSRRAAVWMVPVALTAGVCEELAFRRLLPSLAARTGDGLILPFVVSSLGFGFAHRYQGKRGVILTSVLGALFFIVTRLTGSIAAAACIHALIDLRMGAIYLIVGAIPVPAEPNPAPAPPNTT